MEAAALLYIKKNLKCMAMEADYTEKTIFDD